MKPTLKTVIIERWDCGIPSHSHISEPVAQRCMDKTSKNKRAVQSYEDRMLLLKERNILAARMVVNGCTYSKVAKEIGVSAGRVQIVVMVVLKMCQRPYFDPRDWMIYHDTREVRNDTEYWLKQIDKVADHWGVK